MTIRQALDQATEQLSTAADLRANARRDAELLLMHVASLRRTDLIAYPERELPPDQAASFHAVIGRRLRHEPIQYITGTQEFYGLDFTVTPAVLIPRPETEHLVEAVLERLPHDRPVSVVDIGTGSGAIAVTLAAHLPRAQVTAIDISPDALRVAQDNAEIHNLAPRIRFLLSDRLTALSPNEREAYFDAIVSNPPYVPLDDAPTLHPEVRDYEPDSALYAGSDGLSFYRSLIPEALRALKPGGLLALEFGHGQRDSLVHLLEGWYDIEVLDDLQGIPRVALSRRP